MSGEEVKRATAAFDSALKNNEEDDFLVATDAMEEAAASGAAAKTKWLAETRRVQGDLAPGEHFNTAPAVDAVRDELAAKARVES